ncbi:MAG TPA: hypothetical protein VFU26_15245 [Gaiellaceae bacterium]|nr:hypothetical protein [Gaiellaceae bacterium]
MAKRRPRRGGDRQGRGRRLRGRCRARRGASASIAEALGKLSGLQGKLAVDATNHFQGERPPFESLAHEVKSIVGGPVSKAFNLNFARIYDVIDTQPIRPSNLYCGADEAREVTEQLIRDAGYEPTRAGGLEHARLLEENLRLLIALDGPVFYRYWKPGELS